MDAPTVVLVAGDRALADELRQRFAVVEAGDVAAATALLAGTGPAVVVLGPAAVERTGELSPEIPQIWSLPPADVGARGPVFYVCPPALAAAARARLITAAWAHAHGCDPVGTPPSPPRAPDDPAAAAELHRILATARDLAACSELREAGAQLAAAALELTGSDVARCWFVDGDAGVIWRHDGMREIEARADLGLLGYVARTAATTVLDEAVFDPRFVAGADDPDGEGRGRWLAVAARGRDGHVHAVVVVHRSPRRPPFVDGSIRALEQLAAACGPALEVLAVTLETRALLAGRAASSPFRVEAVREHASRQRNGMVLRVAPGWVRVAYWAVLAIVAVGVAFVGLARIHRYSTGPALIGVLDRTEITAVSPGTIAVVEVAIGDRVRRGDPIARLHDPVDDVDRRRRQFDAALRARLRQADDPTDDPVLGSLRSELEAAEAAHEARIVRAPDDGVIGDLRVRVGQAIAPGDVLAALVRDPSAHEVVAVLPGVDRPQLRAGLPMRLAIAGNPHAHLDLVVDSVGAEVVGPAELARMLGPRGDQLQIEGPAVIVRAPLDAATFEVDGVLRPLSEGLPAIARVRLGRERVLDLIVPGLTEVEDGP